MIYLQNFHFCTKICANDSGTFVGKEGYHLEEGAEVSLLGLRTNGGSGPRTVYHHRSTIASYEWSTVANNGVLRRAELALATLALFGQVAPVHAYRRAAVY